MKKTVVFDFDGVIHSYTSGWQGIAEIPDPPVEGIREAIGEIRAAGYEVVVVSTRTKDPAGSRAVEEYLKRHEIEVDAVMATKPPAIVYVDDRAICFDGNAGTLLEKINNFIPWYENQNKKKWKEPEMLTGKVKGKLNPGDTIKCSNTDEMLYLQAELAKEDIYVDFEYERNGEKGLWLLITSVKQGGQQA